MCNAQNRGTHQRAARSPTASRLKHQGPTIRCQTITTTVTERPGKLARPVPFRGFGLHSLPRWRVSQAPGARGHRFRQHIHSMPTCGWFHRTVSTLVDVACAHVAARRILAEPSNNTKQRVGRQRFRSKIRPCFRKSSRKSALLPKKRVRLPYTCGIAAPKHSRSPMRSMPLRRP